MNKITATYSVTDNLVPTQILGVGFDISQIKSISISDTIVDKVLFDTIGEHEVTFIMDDDKFNTCDRMFFVCTNLVKVDLSEFKSEHVKDMTLMFGNCPNLISIDLTSLRTDNVVCMLSMFANCDNFEKITFPKGFGKSCEIMAHMFYNCHKLEVMNFSNCDLSKVIDIRHMFSGCWKFKELWVTSALNPKLEAIDFCWCVCKDGKIYYDPMYSIKPIAKYLPSVWDRIPLDF